VRIQQKHYRYAEPHDSHRAPTRRRSGFASVVPTISRSRRRAPRAVQHPGPGARRQYGFSRRRSAAAPDDLWCGSTRRYVPRDQLRHGRGRQRPGSKSTTSAAAATLHGFDDRSAAGRSTPISPARGGRRGRNNVATVWPGHSSAPSSSSSSPRSACFVARERLSGAITIGGTERNGGGHWPGSRFPTRSLCAGRSRFRGANCSSAIGVG